MNRHFDQLVGAVLTHLVRNEGFALPLVARLEGVNGTYLEIKYTQLEPAVIFEQLRDNGGLLSGWVLLQISDANGSRATVVMDQRGSADLYLSDGLHRHR